MHELIVAEGLPHLWSGMQDRMISLLRRAARLQEEGHADGAQRLRYGHRKPVQQVQIEQDCIGMLLPQSLESSRNRDCGAEYPAAELL
jgi:hypothetical protein